MHFMLKRQCHLCALLDANEFTASVHMAVQDVAGTCREEGEHSPEGFIRCVSRDAGQRTVAMRKQLRGFAGYIGREGTDGPDHLLLPRRI